MKQRGERNGEQREWVVFQLKTITELDHPPYSLDLTLSDFQLFVKIKYTLKGQRFITTEDIQKNVPQALNSITKEEFQKML